MSAHWGVPDPAAVEGTDEQKRKAFTDAALTLRRRIELFLSLPLQRLDAMSLQHELRALVRSEAGAMSAEPNGRVPAAPHERLRALPDVWVLLCIVAGIALGQFAPGVFQAIGRMEVAQVNLPVGLLIWVMIIPMLLKVDFGALQVKQHWRGIGVTLFVNWAVKPFSMALLAWIFAAIFADWLPADQLDSYIAGLILLAAAPCTAMVFVWSRLTGGDPVFTLSQVALNDTIMVFAFAPIVGLLLGLSSITVPWDTLLTSVGLYIVIPGHPGAALAPALLQGQAAFDRAGAHRPAVHRRCCYAGAAVRLPGRGHHPPAAGHRHAGRADPDPGVLQLRPGLLAQPQGGRSTASPALGADRRLQLLRAGRGRRHQPVRLPVRRGAGHRGRRADRGAGDAAGGARGQPLARAGTNAARTLPADNQGIP
jgi:hypothetical protein